MVLKQKQNQWCKGWYRSLLSSLRFITIITYQQEDLPRAPGRQSRFASLARGCWFAYTRQRFPMLKGNSHLPLEWRGLPGACDGQKLCQTPCVVPWGCCLLGARLCTYFMSAEFIVLICTWGFSFTQGDFSAIQACMHKFNIRQGCLPVSTTSRVWRVPSISCCKTNIVPSSALSWIFATSAVEREGIDRSLHLNVLLQMHLRHSKAI